MHGAMLVMGLDSALQRCSVAILRDGVVLSDKFADMERGHAEHLAPMAASALAEAGVKVADLDRVGVVVGPGGFTGVRIALSFARGLAIGTDLEVSGITSLAALAGNATTETAEGLIAPIIDARRGQVYGALYENSGLCRVEPFVTEPEQVLKTLAVRAGSRKIQLIGSGAMLLPKLPGNWAISDMQHQIDAKIVARLAAISPPPSGSPAPIYLRAPDAKPAKPSVLEKNR